VAVAGASISAIIVLSGGMILLKSVIWRLKEKDNLKTVSETTGAQSQ
jgi:hypothetical protein